MTALILSALLYFPQEAASITETIRIQHMPVASLVYSLPNKQPASGLPPEGITSWVVDEAENSIQVTGTAESVNLLMKYCQLLDIRSKRVRLSITVYDLTRAKPGIALPPPAHHAGIRLASTERYALEIIKSRPILASAEVTAINNRPQELVWNDPLRKSGGSVHVTPRINGDNSISIAVRTMQRGHGLEPLGIEANKRVQLKSYIVLESNPETAVIVTPIELREPKP